MNIENYNYYHDPRTIEGMVPREKIQETKNGVSILFETEDDDGVITVHWLKTRYELCRTCEGRGKHVNASIDCCGLSQEDFDRDPEFEENYFNGTYDVTCNECNGRRVVPILDEGANDPELVAKYQEYRNDLYNDARESASERAMGA